MSTTRAGTTLDVGPAELESVEPERRAPGRGVRWVRARSLELLVASGAFCLFAWAIDRNGDGNSYYAAAIRSMTRSWHNFFYASLDPGGWITLDKPPFAFWLQALSARVFGFNSWSLLLPGAICGALAVWILMATVRRPWGRTAGVVAGVVLALTPVTVAVSRSNNPDGTLVLTVVLAAWATQRAIGDGRARWMALAGLFCGVGFLTKLLAAGLVMPGMWAAFLVAGAGPWKRRVLNCILGGAVFFAVAVGWVALVDLRPLAQRPWIGGSSDGTASDLVFGYNGFGRITGASQAPGGGGFSGGGFPGGLGAGGGGIDQFGGTPGLLRLFNNGMGDQVMWLAPVAAASAIVGLVRGFRRRVDREQFGSVIMWTGWTVVVYVLFAYATGIFHNYYVSLLAPALAALVGIGVAQVRQAGAKTRSALVVALLATAATVALQVTLLRRVDAWTWLRVAVPVAVGTAVGVIALALLIARTARRTKFVVSGVALAGVALLAAPAAWSLAGVQHAQNGTFPDARPTTSVASGPFGGFPGAAPGNLGPQGGPAANLQPTGTPAGAPRNADSTGATPPFGGSGGGGLDKAELRWLTRQRRGEKWILGVQSSTEAASSIIDGYDVVALGGFSGQDAAANPLRVADLVSRHELRYLAVGGLGGFGGGPGLAGSGVDLGQVVRTACTQVDASAWGGSGTSGVWDCRGKAAAMRAAARSKPANPTSPDATGGAPGGGNPGIDLQQIQQCLARRGVELSEGSSPNLSDPKMANALRSCMSQLFPGATGSPPAPQQG